MQEEDFLSLAKRLTACTLFSLNWFVSRLVIRGSFLFYYCFIFIFFLQNALETFIM